MGSKNTLYNSLPTKLALIMILSGLSIVSYAQTDVKKFKFGLKATPSVAWIKPDTKGMINDGVRLGFNYGIVTDFSLGEGTYSFSSGVNIESVNGKISYPDYTNFYISTDTISDFTTTSAKYTIKYIEIPLTLKMRTKEIGYITYFGQFGLGAGFNWKGRKEFTTTASSGSSWSEKNIDVANETALLRTSLIIALGGEYNLSGTTNLVVGVSFNNAFSNMFKSKQKFFELDQNGIVDASKIQVNPETGQFDPKGDTGIAKKAIANYLGLNIGIFF